MSPDEERLQNEICALISAMMRISLKKIALDKSLNFDLGIDGDDAIELFEAYAEKFHVDITPLDAEWDLYFLPEGSPFFGPDGFSLRWVWQVATFLRKRPPNTKLPLPVSRLVASARAGKWIPLSD